MADTGPSAQEARLSKRGKGNDSVQNGGPLTRRTGGGPRPHRTLRRLGHAETELPLNRSAPPRAAIRLSHLRRSNQTSVRHQIPEMTNRRRSQPFSGRRCHRRAGQTNHRIPRPGKRAGDSIRLAGGSCASGNQRIGKNGFLRQNALTSAAMSSSVFDSKCLRTAARYSMPLNFSGDMSGLSRNSSTNSWTSAAEYLRIGLLFIGSASLDVHVWSCKSAHLQSGSADYLSWSRCRTRISVPPAKVLFRRDRHPPVVPSENSPDRRAGERCDPIGLGATPWSGRDAH